MANTHIVRFLGDQVRRLQLTPIMITEVERTTGHGVLALYSAVIHRNARHRDLTEVVRTALIGGGTSAQEADTLVRIYIDGAPVMSTLRLVLEILDATFEGVPEEPVADYRSEIEPHIYRTADGVQLDLDEVA